LKARYVSANLSIEGYVSDLSSEGLFFAADFLDLQGEEARVFIYEPGTTHPVELRGEVRWVSDQPSRAGMGISLIDARFDDRRRLAQLVRAQCPAEPAGPLGHA
jgi:hypothetical protein